MKKIIIKRKYLPKTKEILKEIKNTNDNDTREVHFNLIVMTKEDYPSVQFFKLEWVDLSDNFEKHRVTINSYPSNIMNRVVSEVIGALNNADREVIYLMDTFI